ncbi:hypothetical protein HDK77DRAFT_431359 [Phyllosticta capitalensis]
MRHPDGIEVQIQDAIFGWKLSESDFPESHRKTRKSEIDRERRTQRCYISAHVDGIGIKISIKTSKEFDLGHWDRLRQSVQIDGDWDFCRPRYLTRSDLKEKSETVFEADGGSHNSRKKTTLYFAGLRKNSALRAIVPHNADHPKAKERHGRTLPESTLPSTSQGTIVVTCQRVSEKQKECCEAGKDHGRPVARPDVKGGHSLYIKPMYLKKDSKGYFVQSIQDAWEGNFDLPYQFIFYYRSHKQVQTLCRALGHEHPRKRQKIEPKNSLQQSSKSARRAVLSDDEEYATLTKKEESPAPESRDGPGKASDSPQNPTRKSIRDVSRKPRITKATREDMENPDFRNKTSTFEPKPADLDKASDKVKETQTDVFVSKNKDNPTAISKKESRSDRNNPLVIESKDDAENSIKKEPGSDCLNPVVIEDAIADSVKQELNPGPSKSVDNQFDDTDEEELKLRLRLHEIERQELELKLRLKKLKRKS